jgi:hypothetical protein
MHTSRYLIGFVVASLASAGAIGLGCSSSSSSSPPATSGGNDAAGESSAPTEAGPAPEDAAEEALTDASADVEPCSLEGMVPVDKVDAASFACYEAMCGPALAACAADCQCNRNLNIVLNCQNACMADGGDPELCQTLCSEPILAMAQDEASTNILVCLIPLSPSGNNTCGTEPTHDSGSGGDAGDAGVHD